MANCEQTEFASQLGSEKEKENPSQWGKERLCLFGERDEKRLLLTEKERGKEVIPQKRHRKMVP